MITSMFVAATCKKTSRSGKNRKPKSRYRSNECSTERKQSILSRFKNTTFSQISKYERSQTFLYNSSVIQNCSSLKEGRADVLNHSQDLRSRSSVNRCSKSEFYLTV